MVGFQRVAASLAARLGLDDLLLHRLLPVGPGVGLADVHVDQASAPAVLAVDALLVAQALTVDHAVQVSQEDELRRGLV